jgi:heme/copper-type cytochrome/quinol oxidase subunit 3
MLRHQVFALVLGIAVFNGIFSPLVHLVAAYSFLWMPPWLPAEPSTLFYFSSLIVATTTLLVSGIPAALIEHAVPDSREAPGPNWMWALVALILSFPAVVRLLLVSGVAQ